MRQVVKSAGLEHKTLDAKVAKCVSSHAIAYIVPCQTIHLLKPKLKQHIRYALLL